MRYFLRLLPIVVLCVVCSSCVKEADEQFIPIRMSEPHADNTSISVVVNVHEGYMDMYGYTHYGVVCGTSEDVTKESGTIMDMRALGTFDGYPDGYYEASITDLNPGTTYYIRPYYSRFDALHHGDAVEIVTMGNAGNGGSVFFEESANCYLVSSSGTYKFRAVKGNSSESVGPVASAEVLWESFGTDVVPEVGDLIESVTCSDGYVSFVIPVQFKEGNAVIAAKNASGQILWSWHIWLTDQPESQAYCYNAGTMMDRNLGATSATPGDVGALGLLYQWGRKDPFLGSSSISSNTIAKSTIAWSSAVSSDSSNGTIAYATANPTTFITYNSSNYDWYYTGSSTIDNTRWTTSTATKSIYDPCPASWRVPDGGNNGIWSKALGSSSSFNDPLLYYSTNEGMNFSGKFGSASTIWYPVSGYRFHIGGGLGNVGYSGYYWSASSSSYYAYLMSFNGSGGVNPSSSVSPANGLSVRCIRE